MKIDFVLENNVDPAEIPHKLPFHLGLYCLPTTSLRISNLQNKTKHNNPFAITDSDNVFAMMFIITKQDKT